MDNLYLYLLNRKPTLEERKENNLVNLKLVNKKICQSQEYKKFMKENYEMIKTRIEFIFKIKINLEERVLYDIYHIFRKNNYKILELDKYLIIQKDKFYNELKFFFNQHKITLNCNDFKSNNLLKKYINNSFVSQYTINDIIYSDDFYNLVSRKLELLFEA